MRNGQEEQVVEVMWPGWLGGVGVGLFVVFLFLFTGKGLGVSSAYGNFCGVALRGGYFRRDSYAPSSDWRLWLALGLPLGGLIGLLSAGETFAPSLDMGQLYERVLPQATWARGGLLALGGIMIGYGARAAGGCQSGHAITGMALLNPPSVLAGALFFAGGIVSVQLLFNVLA